MTRRSSSLSSRPNSALVVRMENCRWPKLRCMTTRLRNYAEVRAYFEKEHPDWLSGSDAAPRQRAGRFARA
jgi:hypothetical protein